MELNASNLLLGASFALVVGIAALAIYKVRVRGDHVQEKTLHEVVKLLTFIVLMAGVYLFGFELKEDSWVTRPAVEALALAVGGLFYCALGRKW